MLPFLLTGDPQTLTLGEPYAGAEVEVMADVPQVVALAIGHQVALFGKATDEAQPVEQVKALRSAWATFATSVGLGWNVHDRRGAVPLDAAYGRAPDALLVHVLTLWAELVTPAEEPPADEPPTELVRVKRA